MKKNIILTPLERLEGKKVKYIGYVSGLCVKEIPLDMNVKLAVRGREKREKIMENFLRALRYSALERIAENAEKMGANAVLGLRISVNKVNWKTFEAYAYGTAAEVEK